MALDDTPRLGCGCSMDQIWAGIDQPPTVHEEHCEQCLRARARLHRLQEATLALAESDLADAELKPRPAITNAIMNVARAEVRRGSRVWLRTTQNRTIEVSEQALSSLIRLAATTIPGIHARRCLIEVHSSPEDLTEQVSKGADAPRLIINLRVATSAAINISLAVEELRRAIGKAIPAGVGVAADSINITVEDLYDV